MIPLSAADLRVLADALARLRAVQASLDALVGRTGRLADAVYWEAPSARAFHEDAAALHDSLVRAERLVADAAARLHPVVAGGPTMP